jgi:hypothetical protein
MNSYPFSVDMPFSLEKACDKGFTNVSLVKAKHGRPIYIFLWSEAGAGIKIQCVMHDLEPRLEVGSLVFTRVETNDKKFETKDLPSCFRSHLVLDKLLYTDEKAVVESGVVMTARSGEELLIVSGAFPYTVEICIAGFDQDFDPEYAIADYKREAI